MSDYFSPLRTLEVDATPLPVEDVMRSGDRRRRTLAAGSLLATTALAATVVVGGLALQDEPRTAPPAGPSNGYIPESFPLGADLPFSVQKINVTWASDGPDSSLIPPACGTTYVLAGEPVDRFSIQNSSAVPNGFSTMALFTGIRDLAVFDTADQARTAVEAQAARFQACPLEGDGLRTVTTVAPVDLGDAAWRVERDTVLDGSLSGIEVWYLVHRGTAALVVTEFLDQPAELERRDRAVRELGTDVVAPLVDELCTVRTVC